MKILLLISSFVKTCYLLNPALYTIEKQTRRTTLNEENNNNDKVKPIVSRSPIECALKCRIQLKESFYDASSGTTNDQQNCYCLHKMEDLRKLSSPIIVTETNENSTIDGLYIKEHEVSLFFFA